MVTIRIQDKVQNYIPDYIINANCIELLQKMLNTHFVKEV